MTSAPATYRAVFWMLGAVASFTFMALCIRELSSTLSVFQILFLRSAVGLPLLVVGTFVAGGSLALRDLRTSRLPLHMGRNLVHVVAQLAWIYGITVLPLSMVFAIDFSAPLWAVLLAALFLKERPTRFQLYGLVLGLAGILIIVRPGPEGLSWPVAVVMLSALSYAGSYLLTRMLGRTDGPPAVLFWMCVIHLPITLVLSFLDWRAIPLSLAPLIFLLAVGGLLANCCVTSAFRLAPISQVITYDYLRLPVIAIVGMLFYGEELDPVVLGGGIVVLAGTFLVRPGAGGAPPELLSEDGRVAASSAPPARDGGHAAGRPEAAIAPRRGPESHFRRVGSPRPSAARDRSRRRH